MHTNRSAKNNDLTDIIEKKNTKKKHRESFDLHKEKEPNQENCDESELKSNIHQLPVPDIFSSNKNNGTSEGTKSEN